MLGVIIIGNAAAWTANPLNMVSVFAFVAHTHTHIHTHTHTHTRTHTQVNVFAFGKLSWNTSASATGE